MNVLILDTFPTLTRPIAVQSNSKDNLWVMNRENCSLETLPKSIEKIRFAHSLCETKTTERWIRRFRTLGYTGLIEIAAPPGVSPPSQEYANIVHPNDIIPISITHYGEAHHQILAGGLTITDDPPLFLSRPERFNLAADTPLSTLTAYMSDFVKNHETADHEISLHVEGHHLWRNVAYAESWLEKLLSLPFRWDSCRFRDPGGLSALIQALRSVVSYEVRSSVQSSVRFELQNTSNVRILSAKPFIHQKPITGRVLQQLHSHWRETHPTDSALEGTLRQLDDVDRELVFSHLPRTGPIEGSPVATFARRHLGSPESWVSAYHRTLRAGAPRVCIIPTWQCELRCRYCTIKKQSGREMSEAIGLRALDLLFSAPGPELELHFFGGEPFLEWPLLKRLTEVGQERAAQNQRQIRYQFTTNAFALTEQHLDELMTYNCHFQLSLDGRTETQNDLRRVWKSGDSYARSAAHMAAWFKQRQISHDVICVVHPTHVEHLVDNVQHIWSLGYPTIQLNYAIGAHWDEQATHQWAEQLGRLGELLHQKWSRGETDTLVNFGETRKRVRSNLHLTVDFDGAIYGSNGFLYLEKERERFRLGHLNETKSYTRYMAEGLTEEDLFASWTWKGSLTNNQRIGAILNRFSDAMTTANL